MAASFNGGMFGMINRAIEDLALKRGGVLFWEEVRRLAGVTGDFKAITPYPDELTFRLVWAASELLGIPMPKLLRILGKHWMGSATREGDELVLKLSDGCLSSFFAVLSELEGRMAQTMAHLATLRCIPEDENRLWLEYRSPRMALGPFVVGLLEGIATGFRVDLLIDHVVRASEGEGFDAFRIHLKPVATR